MWYFPELGEKEKNEEEEENEVEDEKEEKEEEEKEKKEESWFLSAFQDKGGIPIMLTFYIGSAHIFHLWKDF